MQEEALNDWMSKDQTLWLSVEGGCQSGPNVWFDNYILLHKFSCTLWELEGAWGETEAGMWSDSCRVSCVCEQTYTWILMRLKVDQARQRPGCWATPAGSREFANQCSAGTSLQNQISAAALSELNKKQCCGLWPLKSLLSVRSKLSATSQPYQSLHSSEQRCSLIEVLIHVRIHALRNQQSTRILSAETVFARDCLRQMINAQPPGTHNLTL